MRLTAVYSAKRYLLLFLLLHRLLEIAVTPMGAYHDILLWCQFERCLLRMRSTVAVRAEIDATQLLFALFLLRASLPAGRRSAIGSRQSAVIIFFALQLLVGCWLHYYCLPCCCCFYCCYCPNSYSVLIAVAIDHELLLLFLLLQFITGFPYLLLLLLLLFLVST